MRKQRSYVGPEEVNMGRSRHSGIRIERYWEGEYPNLRARFIPMLCQQCAHAPCEPVCPVFASYHSDAEGLNVQVYNRCIGTRYRAINCPGTGSGSITGSILSFPER